MAKRRVADRIGAGENVPGWLVASALVLVFVLLALLAIRQVASPDIGFHLKAGEHVLAGKGWPRTDPFTFTVRDHPYVDTSWGYQVVVALVHLAAGAPGLVILHAIVVLALFGLVAWTARSGAAEPATLLGLLLLGGIASEMRFETRPELFSYLMLALVLLILVRHAEGKPAPLWALVPIHLLWANLHALFVLGWVALGCFLAGLLLRDRRLDLRLLGWSAASVAVTVLNPYGLKGVLFPFALATRFDPGNVFAQSIGEFVSPFALKLSDRFPFYPRAPIFAFRAFAVLSGLAIVPAIRRRRYWYPLLWAAFLALSWRMVRNMPLLVVACLPGTAWGLPVSSLLGKLGRKGRARAALPRAVVALVGVAAAVAGLRVWNDAYYVGSRREERFGLAWNRHALPVAAADYVVRARLRGPYLNHLNFGGWFVHALPDPVFIDGRLEVMGEAFYEEYRRVLAYPEALEAAVAKHGLRWIAFPHGINAELLGRLHRDPRWELVYADPLAAVFVRRGAVDPLPVPELPDRRPLPDPRSLPGLGGGERRRGAAAWLAGLYRREEFPFEDHHLGLFELFRGEVERAAARFASAVAKSGGAYYETYNNLGAALYRLKRFPEARACYEVVLQEVPDNRLARERIEAIDRGGP